MLNFAQKFILLLVIRQISGSILKCGENIVVHRGEKKTLRFWSSDEELMKVEIVPEKHKANIEMLVSMFSKKIGLASNLANGSQTPTTSSKETILVNTLPKEQSTSRNYYEVNSTGRITSTENPIMIGKLQTWTSLSNGEDVNKKFTGLRISANQDLSTLQLQDDLSSKSNSNISAIINRDEGDKINLSLLNESQLMNTQTPFVINSTERTTLSQSNEITAEVKESTINATTDNLTTVAPVPVTLEKEIPTTEQITDSEQESYDLDPSTFASINSDYTTEFLETLEGISTTISPIAGIQDVEGIKDAMNATAKNDVSMGQERRGDIQEIISSQVLVSENPQTTIKSFGETEITLQDFENSFDIIGTTFPTSTGDLTDLDSTTKVPEETTLSILRSNLDEEYNNLNNSAKIENDLFESVYEEAETSTMALETFESPNEEELLNSSFIDDSKPNYLQANLTEVIEDNLQTTEFPVDEKGMDKEVKMPEVENKTHSQESEDFLDEKTTEFPIEKITVNFIPQTVLEFIKNGKINQGIINHRKVITDENEVTFEDDEMTTSELQVLNDSSESEKVFQHPSKSKSSNDTDLSRSDYGVKLIQNEMDDDNRTTFKDLSSVDQSLNSQNESNSTSAQFHSNSIEEEHLIKTDELENEKDEYGKLSLKENNQSANDRSETTSKHDSIKEVKIEEKSTTSVYLKNSSNVNTDETNNLQADKEDEPPTHLSETDEFTSSKMKHHDTINEPLEGKLPSEDYESQELSKIMTELKNHQTLLNSLSESYKNKSYTKTDIDDAQAASIDIKLITLQHMINEIESQITEKNSSESLQDENRDDLNVLMKNIENLSAPQNVNENTEVSKLNISPNAFEEFTQDMDIATVSGNSSFKSPETFNPGTKVPNESKNKSEDKLSTNSETFKTNSGTDEDLMPDDLHEEVKNSTKYSREDIAESTNEEKNITPGLEERMDNILIAGFMKNNDMLGTLRTEKIQDKFSGVEEIIIPQNFFTDSQLQDEESNSFDTKKVSFDESLPKNQTDIETAENEPSLTFTASERRTEDENPIEKIDTNGDSNGDSLVAENPQKQPLNIESNTLASKRADEMTNLVKDGSSTFADEVNGDNIASFIRNSILGTGHHNREINNEQGSIEEEGTLQSNSEGNGETLIAFTNGKPVLIEEQGSKVIIIKPENKETENEELIVHEMNHTAKNERNEPIHNFESLQPSPLISISHPNRIYNREPDFSLTENNAVKNDRFSGNEEKYEYLPFGLSLFDEDSIQKLSIENSFRNTNGVNPSLKEFDANDSISLLSSPTSETEVLEDEFSADHEREFSKNSPDMFSHSIIDQVNEVIQNYVQNNSDQKSINPESHSNEHKQNSSVDHSLSELLSHAGYTVQQEEASTHVSKPLPFLLQTRKGLVKPTFSKEKYSRRDNSHPLYEDEASPFYIKLPGTSNAVPVYLQYEPVEVKYVNSGEINKQANVDNFIEKTNNMILPEENRNQLQDEAQRLDEHFEVRPDPFFVMDPPNLARSETDLPEENEETYSVELKKKYVFKEQEENPSVITGNNLIPQKDYIIKTPDISYSASDTASLTNPIFSLGSKATAPSSGASNPQYTPFPLTTNPPKPTTSIPITTAKTPKLEPTNMLPLVASKNWTENIVAEKKEEIKSNVTIENPPSMLFSPPPSIEFNKPYIVKEVQNTDKSETAPQFSSVRKETQKHTNDTVTKHENQFPGTEEVKESTTTTARSREEVKLTPKTDEDFDIVALANFLHQNQKVWSDSKMSPISGEDSWQTSSWDSIKYSRDDGLSGPSFGVSPWLLPEGELGEERFYSAFYSPEEIPGIDPTKFSYRQMPSMARSTRSTVPETKLIKRYVRSLPEDLRKAVMLGDEEGPLSRKKRSTEQGKHVYCEWNIKTDPGLYMLVTFHNLSAPYTVDCHGAYIEVERENNGYDARWCGNHALESRSYRPHVIFVKSEVRITVYDNGKETKNQATGFEADIEVIDLFDTDDYKTFIENKATPRIRRLMKG